MALNFRFGQVFSFNGNSGKIYGLSVKQDVCGGLTIRNDSPDQVVIYVKSIGPSTFFHWVLKPGGDWVHIHGLYADSYDVNVRVMPRLMAVLEVDGYISWESLYISRLFIDLGILPEYVDMGGKFDFELKIN